MFNRVILRLLLAGVAFASLMLSAVSQPTLQDAYLSIDQVTSQLEQKFRIRLFYKPEWFEKRNFHASILELPLEEALDRIKTAAELSAITVDSVLYIFVPLKSVQNPVNARESTEVLTIGEPNDYGKYAKATLQGKILDGKNGSTLPGASVIIDKLKLGTRTDEKGNYRLKFPVGDYTLRISFMGYEDITQKIKLVGNGTFNAELFEKSVKLDEVVISSQRAAINVTGTQMSVIKLDSKTIRELPGTLGETDIIKSITLVPGVQTVGEFGTGFNVRGGGADQNLILIEDVPLFNSSHLFGLTSVVNPDGITSVTLLKAGIPAKYGERASSVMDIQMGNNNGDKTMVKGGIGLINSRLNVELPLFSKKVILMLGGRSSYSNWLLHSIPDIDLMNSSARFYDVNALLSFNLNTSNKINLFAYRSADQFSFSRNTDYQYGNFLSSIKWNHTFDDNLYFNLSAGISHYRYQVSESDTSKSREAYKINSSLNYTSVKWNFSWLPGQNHLVDFGINTVLYSSKPGDLKPYNSESLIKPVQMHLDKAGEYAVYLSDNFTISPKLSFDMGLRYSAYTYLGPNKVYVYRSNAPRNRDAITDSLSYGHNQVIYWYSGIEPRISVRLALSDKHSLKLSYNRIHQYINLVSNTAVMTPSDVWKLSTPNLKPLLSDHFTLGYYHNFGNNTIETSIELYYKRLTNTIDYKNGAKILLNPYLESDLINVNGKNYGIEFYVKKNTGRLTGWASYTYSRSWHQSGGVYAEEKINNNYPFPSSYDKPNSLIINANYHVSRRWRLGGLFTYSSGRPVTLPELKYSYQDFQLVQYSDRNKYRLPDYHRLDLSITLDESLKIRKKWKGSWTFSIVNLYGRKNVYSVFYKKEDHMDANEYKEYDLYMLYIIGRPLPTLTYNFTF